MKHKYSYLPGEIKRMTDEAYHDGWSRGMLIGAVIYIPMGIAVAMGTVALWARFVV